MFVYVFIPLLGMNAQSQVVRDMTNALTELTGSFLDNPYHHSNTVKVNDLTQYEENNKKLRFYNC